MLSLAKLMVYSPVALTSPPTSSDRLQMKLSLDVLSHQPASGPQPSGSRRKKGTNTEVIIQAPADPPLQEDVLEAGDDLDDQPQAKVCVFMTQYLICDKQSSDTYGQMAPASW